MVDAVCSGGAAGNRVPVRRGADRSTERFRHRGTHTFSLADVIELARALGLAARHLTGYGIEGASFAIGDGLSAGGGGRGGQGRRASCSSDLKAGV